MSKKNDASTTQSQSVKAQFSQQVVEERLTPNILSAFPMDTDALRLSLVTAQYALRATRQQTPPNLNKPTGLLVLVNGMEQAGKGTAVKQLRQWVDPRLLKVEATIGYPPLSYQPLWQAHSDALPRHGDVMVYFGNWYADLLYNIMRMTVSDLAKGNEPLTNSVKTALPIAKWEDYLQQQLMMLQAYEDDLAANHTKLLKCWFHVDAETLKKRLEDDKKDPDFLYQIDWSDMQVLAQFNQVAVTLLEQQNDWIIIDGSDKSQAATQFCHEVLHAMQKALESSIEVNLKDSKSHRKSKKNKSSGTYTLYDKTTAASKDFEAVAIPEILTNIDNSAKDKEEYQKQLEDKQSRLAELLRARQGRHVVFAFEGMDAAGKGGAIKRLVAPLDPREYQVYNIGAPMLYELQHPYLWRFWTKLPNEQTDRISRIAIFDRTWYGRVLVERVESLASDDEWQRAYNEINRFESDLSKAGTLIIKYWLAIDKKEQLKRFESRKETPHKQFKLTDEDWRNRDKWSDYVQSAADMLARTDTEATPWCIVATNDKRQARLRVLDHAIEQLSAALST